MCCVVCLGQSARMIVLNESAFRDILFVMRIETAAARGELEGCR